MSSTHQPASSSSLIANTATDFDRSLPETPIQVANCRFGGRTFKSHFIGVCTGFYRNWKTNEAYLSAYFIICAGSKIVQKNKKYGLENPQVFVEDQMNVATMTKDGEVYHMKMAVQPTEILANLDDWKHHRLIERVLAHGKMPKEEAADILEYVV
ncbi:unnamed protein product [Caenorhabditis nigoni]